MPQPHLPSVAGGGVPVEAYGNATLGAVHVPMSSIAPPDGRWADWAMLTPTAPPAHELCQATTKRGEPCMSRRVAHEGDLTALCVGHWNGVLAYARRLEAQEAQGSQTDPDPQVV